MDTVYFSWCLVGVVTSSQIVKGKERKEQGVREKETRDGERDGGGRRRRDGGKENSHSKLDSCLQT